ncbi:MAG: site-2 protease family protein [Planctomycetota bacterium]
MYVHWTLSLLVAYVAYEGWQDGLVGSVYSVLLLCGMFFCVTLHEYGHALTARRFGVETVDITLLPVGGVARLAKIPRVPWQELLVAVAGPAVNVVLASALLALLTVIPLGVWPGSESTSTVEDSLRTPSLTSFLFSMLVVNTALVLFNMVPAFPMDGGRVLRSLLAMVISYRNATRVAAMVGILCSIGMLIAAVYYRHPVLALIAIFIGYAGTAERRHVEWLEPIRHLTVGTVMTPSPPRLSMDTPLIELPDAFAQFAMPAIPLVGVGQIFTGMLSAEDVSEALQHSLDPTTPAGMIARHDVEPLSPESTLESLIMRPRSERHFAVVDDSGKLIGIVDRHSLLARARDFSQPGNQ